MKYKSWLISIMVGIVLGGILYTTGLFRDIIAFLPVKAASTSDEILNTILISHTKWTTLQGNAQFTWYGSDGSTQIYNNKFAIAQPASAYIDITNLSQSGKNDGIWVSNGKAIYNLNKEAKTYQSQIISASTLDLSMLPKDLSQVQPNIVYIHPMALHVGAPIMEDIYSSWFAQKSPTDTYVFKGTDKILDRDVWVIDDQEANGDSDTVWVDQATGIILQDHQIIDGKLFLDMKMTDLQVDAPVNNSLFVLPAGYSLANPQ